MNSPKTPAETLPSLKSSTEAMEDDFIHNVTKHAENTFDSTRHILEEALSTIESLEEQFDQVDQLLEKFATQRHQDVQKTVRAAIQDVAADNAHNIHNPTPEGAETPKRRNGKRSTKNKK